VIRGTDGSLKIVDVTAVGEEALVVHDPTTADGGLAYSLARLAEDPSGPTPIGIFRDVSRHVYGRGAGSRDEPSSETELDELLHTGENWTIA
jgi:2-oxoglutarate/2-oxoacid ferredoxin oxidoreductase subunit beta